LALYHVKADFTLAALFVLGLQPILQSSANEFL